jgi:hypothetical protein
MAWLFGHVVLLLMFFRMLTKYNRHFRKQTEVKLHRLIKKGHPSQYLMAILPVIETKSLSFSRHDPAYARPFNGISDDILSLNH